MSNFESVDPCTNNEANIQPAFESKSVSSDEVCAAQSRIWPTGELSNDDPVASDLAFSRAVMNSGRAALSTRIDRAEQWIQNRLRRPL